MDEIEMNAYQENNFGKQIFPWSLDSPTTIFPLPTNSLQALVGCLALRGLK